MLAKLKSTWRKMKLEERREAIKTNCVWKWFIIEHHNMFAINITLKTIPGFENERVGVIT